MTRQDRVALATGLLTVVLFNGCERKHESIGDVVIAYVAVDQHYAEPILRTFERETGLRVQPVYDTESSKTTGLVHRIISERQTPRADLFWNNEVAQTIALKERGLLTPYVPRDAAQTPLPFRDPQGYWHGVGARARVIVYNTERLPADAAPRSIMELLRPDLRSQVAMAYPLFGTSYTHAVALFTVFGHQRAGDFFQNLMDNDVRFVDGNATVRDMVAAGTMLVGLTDSDDVQSGMSRGQPINMVIPDQEGIGTLVLPTTVCLVNGAPHPYAAQRLADFLVSDQVERILAACEAAYMPLRPGVEGPTALPEIESLTTLRVDYDEISRCSPSATEWLRENIRR